LNFLADNLQQTGKFRYTIVLYSVNEDDIFKSVSKLYQQCKGGYACITMIAGYGIIGFRDPNGIRPLILGERKTRDGMDYMMASESVSLEALGFVNFSDCNPGEAVLITKSGVTRRQCCPAREFTPCIFEYVYFARPDSIIDQVSVYKARLALGDALADSVMRALGDKMDIDVVIPVPDTSRASALQASYKLKIIYREGFVKNRYIGRTFIMPGQKERFFIFLFRIKSVRRKLNPMKMEFYGKNVLLVDGFF
jgi:amidophosphoribosyltransferase